MLGGAIVSFLDRRAVMEETIIEKADSLYSVSHVYDVFLLQRDPAVGLFSLSQEQDDIKESLKTMRALPPPPLLLFLALTSTCAFVSRHKYEHSPHGLVLQAAKSPVSVGTLIQIGPHIGSGSYGTVHTVFPDGRECVGKRAWTLQEIQQQAPELDKAKQKDRAQRCAYYWMVEQHCFAKMAAHPGLPQFQGVAIDEDGVSWMLFEKIKNSNGQTGGGGGTPSLQDLMDLDLADHQVHAENRLLHLSAELGVTPDGDTEYLAQIIDTVIEQTLQVLIHIHDHAIVHRDLKPSNLLVSNGRIALIDFGSAADLDTAGVLKKNIGLSEKVAISPIYAAPELFVDASLPRTAVNFDCFSAALIFCQILFQYLDERTDAGFFRQLAEANYSLDAWLETELSQDVRSSGLEQGLSVLALRPGLWKLLQNMLLADPRDRLTSKDALNEWKKIMRRIETGTVGNHYELDSHYLADVLESLDLCTLADMEAMAYPESRPLHYVATFRRGVPLGLMLAESDTDPPDDMKEEDRARWKTIQKEGAPGQVFVQGVVPGSQADEIGIFQVGDQLQGVGELPLGEGGFEKALELIQDQPRGSKFITLHLDRRPSALSQALGDLAPLNVDGLSIIRDQGAWSSRGRRGSQEDRFVLHELHDTKDRSFLLAGVFDGHLGSAASEFMSERLPLRISDIIVEENASSLTASHILERAWNELCDEYRATCTNGECVADYDSREGTLDAYTSSRDAVAGTTGSVVMCDESKGLLAVLNCGDSRSLVMDAEGKVKFCTQDHQPEFELERFAEGIKAGLAYSQPECRFSKWQVAVGDYNYAVSRSLEGPFANSVGIVSTPDVTTLKTVPGMIVLVATDGLWETMDSNEVARILKMVRENGTNAADASKILCSMALEKGSRDNISAVVVYMD